MRTFLLWLCLGSVAVAGEAKWWKGNLHTHTLWSDGDDFPEMVADWYKRQGYHFLALSDHNIIADHERWVSIPGRKIAAETLQKYETRFGGKWVETREKEVVPKAAEPLPEGQKPPAPTVVREVRLKMLSEFRPALEEPEKFLMIPSEEITSGFLSSPLHINATNLREKIPPQKGQSIVEVMQKTVDAVYAQRERLKVPMFPHINHPNFGWAITAEELAQVDRERFFEVYNGHPQVNNEGSAVRANTDRIWDILLTKRLAELGKDVVFGLGTDDSHHYHTKPVDKAQAAPPTKRPSGPGRGWVMVRAESLEAGALIAAMEAGDFYASSGVTLKDVVRDKTKLAVEIAAEEGVTYTTEFFGTRKGYDGSSEAVVDEKGNQPRTTRRYSKDVGAVLATVTGPSAVYELKGDEIYVRARITSSKPKSDPGYKNETERAWTQPLVTGVK